MDIPLNRQGGDASAAQPDDGSLRELQAHHISGRDSGRDPGGFGRNFDGGMKARLELPSRGRSGQKLMAVAQWPGRTETWLELEARTERLNSQDRTTDQRFDVLSASLSRSLPRDLSLRLSSTLRNPSVFAVAAGDRRIQETDLNLDRRIRLAGLPGRVSLGLQHRTTAAAAGKSEEWTPSLAMNRSRGAHSLGLHYSFPQQNFRAAATPDVHTSDAGLCWQYRRGDRAMGVDWTRSRRSDETSRWTRAYQVGFIVQQDFDRNIRRSGGQVPSGHSAHGATQFPLDLLQPGMSLAEAESRLAVSGLSPAPAQGNLRVWESPLFDDVLKRQRFVLEAIDGRVKRAAVVVVLDRLGALMEIMDLLDRVRRTLIARHGAPARSYERGAVTRQLAAELRAASSVRLYDWDVDGKRLRLGIPRRIDGRLRLEVQLAEDFPSEKDTAWGLDALR